MEKLKEAALAFFYCSGVVSQKRDARLVIGSILKQLIRRWSARTGISQMTLISPLYEKFKESDGTSVLEEFSAQITALSTTFESTYVIIDGLDEIADLQKAIWLTRTLEGVQNMHLLIVSRLEQDIRRAFVGENQLHLEENMFRTDISCHVQWQLDHDEKLKLMKPTLKQNIKTRLENGEMYALTLVPI